MPIANTPLAIMLMSMYSYEAFLTAPARGKPTYKTNTSIGTPRIVSTKKSENTCRGCIPDIIPTPTSNSKTVPIMPEVIPRFLFRTGRYLVTHKTG